MRGSYAHIRKWPVGHSWEMIEFTSVSFVSASKLQTDAAHSQVRSETGANLIEIIRMSICNL
jgi:hypothetical protein